MIFKFTQKANKVFKIGKLTKVEYDGNPYLEWYVNIFSANRVQYVISTSNYAIVGTSCPADARSSQGKSDQG